MTPILSKRQSITGKQELTPGNCYRVITVEYDSYRLMADDGRASLYDTYLFDVISDVKHSDWIAEFDDAGKVIYSGPVCFSSPGFFEDYWDGEAEAQMVVRKRLSMWSKGEDRIVNE